MSGLDNCPAITNDNHYLMGPPGGVAFHGAARSRESAGFLDPWSSSSFAQVVDFIDATGKIVKSYQTYPMNDGIIILDINSMSSGAYILNIKTQTQSVFHKLIVE